MSYAPPVKNKLPRIRTILDGEFSEIEIDHFEAAIQHALLRIFQDDSYLLFPGNDEEKGRFHKQFDARLPAVHIYERGGGPYTFRLYVLSEIRWGSSNFLQQMITRWLVRDRIVNIGLCFFSDFQLPDYGHGTYTMHEMVIQIEEEEDAKIVRKNLDLIVQDVKMGVRSLHDAHQILNSRGPSADEKGSLIQEKIAYYAHRYPASFSTEILEQMQHFLVMSSELFKSVRDCAQLIRIIYNFYKFRREIRYLLAGDATKRYIQIDLRNFNIGYGRGMKKVLGVCIGVNYLSENEIFEEKHLLKAFRRYFPMVRAVKDSYFHKDEGEDRVRLVYLEIEKEDGQPFNQKEIQLLRSSLPIGLKNQIARLISPVFMPRNEEEVLKNLILLSNQIKTISDPLQLMISFEEQVERSIVFTVALVRVMDEKSIPLTVLLKGLSDEIAFQVDRVKKMGSLGSFAYKEAAVLRVKVPRKNFTRVDHSIDLYKARLYVAQALETVFGRIRDFNGGLYMKEMEVFRPLRELVDCRDKEREFLLENLFHTIYPVELKAAVPPEYLARLYQLLIDLVDHNGEGDKWIRISQEKENTYVALKLKDGAQKFIIEGKARDIVPDGRELLSTSIVDAGVLYMGLICFSDEREVHDKLVEMIKGLDARSG